MSIPGVLPNAYGVGTDGQLIGGASFFGPAYVTVRSGRFAAYEDGGASLDQNLLLSQTVMLDPGLYEVGYYLGADSPQQLTGYGSNAHIFVNGTPLRLTAPQCRGNVCSDLGIIPGDGSFQLFSGRFHALGGPIAMAFLVGGSGTGAAGISVDDAYIAQLAPVPEPSTLLLVASGLIGAARGHKRRRTTSNRSR